MSKPVDPSYALLLPPVTVAAISVLKTLELGSLDDQPNVTIARMALDSFSRDYGSTVGFLKMSVPVLPTLMNGCSSAIIDKAIKSSECERKVPIEQRIPPQLMKNLKSFGVKFTRHKPLSPIARSAMSIYMDVVVLPPETVKDILFDTIVRSYFNTYDHVQRFWKGRELIDPTFMDYFLIIDHVKFTSFLSSHVSEE